ncbi:MAG TPA: sugar ABC transporter ATP-binding protein [Candidatus Atribacteria bacterium]|nr:sugar ABC transporter ATP-binding protein [Candidatus Atribacteria bacterium]
MRILVNDSFKNKENRPILTVKNISKRFGNVQALKNVSMEVCKGDIVGLLGDNGAGKSTLIKIISGNFSADEGEIFLEGKKVHFNSPSEARAAGIETVYQNSPVCINAAVYENFFIGREIVNNYLGIKFVKNKEMQKSTLDALQNIGISIPSEKAEIGLLSGGERQAIILGRFFHWGGKVALLDEPFAALGVAESRKALKLIHNVSQKGLPIILVTHNIEYAFQVMNKYVVLRHGEVVGVGEKKDVSVDDVVSMITGAIEIKD